MDYTDIVENVSKELLLLRATGRFIELCELEGLAGKNTVYTAKSRLFDPNEHQHRTIIRRAILFLQTLGRLQDWNVDEKMPEFIPAAPIENYS